MDMKKFLSDLERLVNIDCGSNVPEGVQEVTEIFKKELENDWIVEVYPQNDGKFLSDLERLVNIDCGSNVPEGVQEVTEIFKKELENDWIVEVYPQNDGKNPVLVAKNRDSEDIDLMFLGHNDTVFPRGTVPAWSYKLDGNIATGAGVYDMKSGVLSMIEVAKEFKNEDITIALVMNTDEEISSLHSRPIIEKMGAKAKYAMVFEPARKNGNAVIERKGLVKYKVEFFGKASHARPIIEKMGAKAKYAMVFEPARKNGNAVIERKGLVKYKVEFFGKASHAGNYPQEGINAIVEAAHWVGEISKLHNWDIKNSLNVGLIEGGAGVNIVPDYACFKFEGRSHQVEFFETIRKTMEELQANPKVAGIKVKVEEIGYRPPLVLNDKSALLRDLFDESKKEMGIKYDWEVAGGCSDGNFLGVLGVGVVDAVGPVGALLRDLFDESKKEMGIKYDWEVAGGCSDGNFLGVLGVGVVDAVGPVGGEAHSKNEYGNFLGVLGVGVVDAVGPVGGEAHSKNEYLDVSTVEERINLAKSVVRKMIYRKII